MAGITPNANPSSPFTNPLSCLDPMFWKANASSRFRLKPHPQSHTILAHHNSPLLATSCLLCHRLWLVSHLTSTCDVASISPPAPTWILSSIHPMPPYLHHCGHILGRAASALSRAQDRINHNRRSWDIKRIFHCNFFIKKLGLCQLEIGKHV